MVCFSVLQPPPETGLKSKWNGLPVPFFSNSSYSCANSSIFFLNDRDQQAWNLTCLPGGVWQTPIWPSCVSSMKKWHQIINHFGKVKAKAIPYPAVLILINDIYVQENVSVFFWNTLPSSRKSSCLQVCDNVVFTKLFQIWNFVTFTTVFSYWFSQKKEIP